MTMSDGGLTIYEGTFEKDQFHGRGKLHFKMPGMRDDNGKAVWKVFEGIFENGIVDSGSGMITFSNKSSHIYLGECNQDFER